MQKSLKVGILQLQVKELYLGQERKFCQLGFEAKSKEEGIGRETRSKVR